AKRGRPAPGEHREERETGRWKSQGRPGHLTEMEGFSLFEKASRLAQYSDPSEIDSVVQLDDPKLLLCIEDWWNISSL
ncbi:UNVERIFIED_CONTAM: hypothetical protein Sangu_3172300, partial [Sesamum angustifolium]